MDNIEMVLKVLQEKGIQKEDLFLASDLYYKKNMPKVVTVIQRVADLVMKKKKFTINISFYLQLF